MIFVALIGTVIIIISSPASNEPGCRQLVHGRKLRNAERGEISSRDSYFQAMRARDDAGQAVPGRRAHFRMQMQKRQNAGSSSS